LPRTNTLAYLGVASVKKKKFYNIAAQVVNVFLTGKPFDSTRLLALTTNIREDEKGLPRANTLTYLA
jgi:hypothetical protein